MSDPITFDFKGLKELQLKLSKAPVSLKKEIGAELKFSAEAIAGNAIKNAPKDQGQLAQRISAKQEGETSYSVVAAVLYAAYQEWGTKSRAVVPPELQAYANQFKVATGSLGRRELFNIILRWVIRKGISGTYSVKTKRRTGSKINQLAEDYAVAEAIFFSIVKKGIHPHPFFFANFEKEKPNLIRNIENVLKNII